jgi:hypothetical protein
MAMAKKSKARVQTLSPRQQSPRKPLTPRRWRLKLVIGGTILAVVLGIGVVFKYNPGLVRFLQQRDLAPHLQGPGDKHYTLGTAGAAVVIKEFSDYT